MNAQDLLPSPADVEFYNDHGCWITPKIFSDEQIDEALDGARRYYAGQRDSELPAPIKRYLNWTPDQAERRLAKDDYVVLQSTVLRGIGLAPAVGAIAACLARTDEVRLFSSSLITSPQRWAATPRGSGGTWTARIGRPAPPRTCSRRGSRCTTATLRWAQSR